jgi:hypothetical protein
LLFCISYVFWSWFTHLLGWISLPIWFGLLSEQSSLECSICLTPQRGENKPP